MSATEGVIAQWNMKAPNGAMYNVYGHDEQSFLMGLAIIQDQLAVLAALEQQITGVGNVTASIPVAPPQQQPQAQPAAPQWDAAPAPQAAAPQFQQPAAAPACAHGARVPRKGMGAKGEWRGWMCPTPKNTPSQCQPEWVRQGSAEWNAFPA